MTNTVPISGLQSGTPDAADLIPGVDVFDPTQSANGTTKKYVRWSEFNFILEALGQRVLDACRVTTTGNLSASYNNGVAGIGAQLTNNGVKAALFINGVSLNFGDRVLVKNQTASLQNGVYQVVSVGSTSINWVLERSSDYDQPAEIQQFDTVMVVEGTIGNNTAYQLSSATPLIIGTDSINFSAYDINLVQDVVPVSRGGTGQTSYTNGQLLIGRTSDGTLVKNTLTAGTGISIVNSGGAITIATSPTTTVNSVTGTLNRITASPSTGDVVLDISPSYVGQASITTLGTITSGTWGASTIATNKGGTGQITYNNGELLIGNASAGGTLSKALLTAGPGISITNGAGSITIASTVSGVTSVGISGANGIGVSGSPITSSGIITLSLGSITPASVAAVGTVTGSNLSGTNTGDQTMFGTANRITASAAGTNYTFDIAGTYVGQTSITTLGTITTGSWAAATIPVDKGGTGQTSYTNGQLLIGNSTGNTLSKATLTAGTGISITNGSGSITISATASSGTVTSVAVTGANGIGVSGSPITSSGTIDLTLGTITGATWNGNVISTTYTQAQLISATGTADRITVGGTSTDLIVDISASYAGQASITTLGTISSGTWEGSSISTTYTDAKVVSIAGTGARISVGGSASIPSIDIASNYAGQASITTLGTISSGTWNASTLDVGYGGTGQVTYTDGQLLIGNSTGNTLSKATLTAGTGVSITNGAGSITISLDGSASVSSVSGTANRITVSPTVGNVVVDIAGAYVGQASITTLGTITSGTWNGTVIDGSYVNYNATNLKVTSNALNTIQDISTSSTPRFANVILPGVAYGELLVANDTSALTSVAYSSTGGTTNICGRDLYGNSRANSYYSDLTNTVSAGGTTALLESSSRLQTLSGTANQTYTLPDATFLLDGFTFEFFNNSTGTLTVKDFASTTLASVGQGGYVSVVLENTVTPAGNWSFRAADSGVDSISGTANQINVSSPTGAVTLSLSSTLVLPGTLQLGGSLNGDGYDISDIINFTFGDDYGYLRTHTHASDSFALQAYDVDGAAYTSFISLIAGNSPSCLIEGNTTYNGNKIGIAYGGTNATAQTTNGVTYFDGTSITSDAYFSYTAANSRMSITRASEPGSLYFIDVGSGYTQFITSYGSVCTKTTFCNNTSIQDDYQLASASVGASIILAPTLMTIGTTSATDVRFIRVSERLRLTSSGASVTGDISGTSDLYLSKNSSSAFYQQTSETGIGLGSRYRMRRSQGTVASPTDVTEPDQDLGAFYFDAYRNGGWNGVAAQLVTMDGTPSNTSLPTAYNWLTTPVGGIAATVKMTLNNAGDLWLKKCLNVGLLNTSPSGLAHFIGEGTTDTRTYIDQYRASSSSYGGITFRKAAGTYASPSAVFNGYTLGSIDYYGYDGTAFIPGAIIQAVVSGVVGTNDMPTSLTFRTTADGAAVTAERARFSASGNYFVGNNGFECTSPTNPITVGEINTALGELIKVNGTAAQSYMSFYNNTSREGYIGTYTSGSGLVVSGDSGGLFLQSASASILALNDFFTWGANGCFGYQAGASGGVFVTKTSQYGKPAVQAVTSAFAGDDLFINPAGGKVSINTTSSTRMLTVAGVGAVNDQILYLRQTNDYGYSFNMDTSSSGRMYIVGVNNGVETSSILTLDRTNTYVGVGATAPTNKLSVFPNAAAPTTPTAGTASGALSLHGDSTAYGLFVGIANTGTSWLQGMRSDASAATYDISLNPIGGNVGIGLANPGYPLTIQRATTSQQLSIVYSGTTPANNKEIQLGYNGSSGSGYGWIQSIHNGTAYTPLCLNPYGSYVGIGTLNPEEILHIAKAGSGTIGARILLENTASYATNNACEIGFLTDVGASASSYNANIKAIQDGSGIAYTALTFGTYNGGGTPAERVRISPAGDVSIGIAASARAKLEVAGDIWTDWNDRFIGTVFQFGVSYKMGFATTTSSRTLDLMAMSADTSAIRFWVGPTPTVYAYIDYVGNVVLGSQVALATSATNGFVYIPTSAGAPTGVPTSFTGKVAMEYDTTNNKLYVYNGGWKSVTLT